MKINVLKIATTAAIVLKMSEAAAVEFCKWKDPVFGKNYDLTSLKRPKS
jgi:hypothetical protein